MTESLSRDEQATGDYLLQLAAEQNQSECIQADHTVRTTASFAEAVGLLALPGGVRSNSRPLRSSDGLTMVYSPGLTNYLVGCYREIALVIALGLAFDHDHRQFLYI